MSKLFFILILSLAGLNSFAQVEAHFNTPRNLLNGDNTLKKKLQLYLDGALSNSRVHISFYQFKSNRILKAIKQAHERGVIFSIVMDNTALKDSYKEVTDKLIKIVGDQSIKICRTPGCINPDRNNHNKFFLFEKIKIEEESFEYTTIQTSHNFKKSQNYNFNDMIIFKNNYPLYASYLTYWEKLNSGEIDLDFMASGDNGEILILQSFFIGNRAKEMLKELKRIKATSPKCEIRAILRNDEKHNDLKNEIKASGLDFYNIKRWESFGISNHSKAMLLTDHLDRKIIYTGSMNISDRSLKGDEALIKLENVKVYEQFKNYWLKIRKRTQN